MGHSQFQFSEGEKVCGVRGSLPYLVPFLLSGNIQQLIYL